MYSSLTPGAARLTSAKVNVSLTYFEADERLDQLRLRATTGGDRLRARLELPVGSGEDPEDVREPWLQVVSALVPSRRSSGRAPVVGLLAPLDQLLEADEPPTS